MLKKLLTTLTVSALLILGAQGINARAINNEKWMGSIDGNKQISDLSIPGTHDSGARYEPVQSVAKCQELSIDDQLNAGVRYIDVRCREIGDSFTIHHGPVYQNLNFDDVLKSCKDFLKTNPTETIIMSVKEEYNPTDNTKLFKRFLKSM
ncbi:MAG: phosphatidylinositol-specific phospholipase C domain-containing protein [Romboutsia sp.]|uniref:phosphatidylinositol-specific phospholipase C domain-containing protein n=1 Tax=Clostridium sp. DSM 8431 TaxID=1761781 RepID=UPI0008EA8CB3|nr:phosphatidylinositol-specific phospholipase C domain-containing protein [Clostridium sp. DSM 8431]MBQ3420203.1 phosphatidylinositol-specific phospholipase C domain-containing protein [Romboutsia sp.]SFU89542.1 Phosphatidylinositol-specific phospholipase C, X domain [Clostridium sp. DSM 8431]